MNTSAFMMQLKSTLFPTVFNYAVMFSLLLVKLPKNNNTTAVSTLIAHKSHKPKKTHKSFN